MSLLQQALRAGEHAPSSRPVTSRVALVIGAGGALGSAVLEQALVQGGFAQVRALVHGPVAAAMRGFLAQRLEDLHKPGVAAPDTAFIVFDRERHANGREAAFVRPQPAQLLSLATCLHEAGVRRLVIVLPHAPALLPQALKHGLATLDEQAVAALHFEHLVLVRSAQAPEGGDVAGGWLPRLGRALLSQLHWMVPQQEQPVRAAAVAGFVARVARHLPEAPAGTRVAPPELVWRASQGGDVDALVQAWLLGIRAAGGAVASTPETRST